jgi:DNA-binding transcriptional MerR regulator
MTGIPQPTLRAWERRYGLPRPERTTSGYRMYSAHEVSQAQEMRRLCESGMAAAEAAALVRSGGGAPPDAVTPAVVGDAYRAAIDALMDAVLRFDDQGIELVLRRALFLGSTGTLVDRIFVPALREIGDRWYAGELSVAQEHLVTHRLSTVLRDLLRLSAGGDSGATVVLASFADDEHELGLLCTAIRCSLWGLRPVILGARTPPAAIRTAVKALSPSLVALSVTISPSRARARELADDYANACGDVPWVVGGAGLRDIADIVQSAGALVIDPGSVDPEERAGGLSQLHRIVRDVIERAGPKKGPRRQSA